MIGVVVAAHGQLAQALLMTAQLVVRGAGRCAAVGIADGDDAVSYQARLSAAVDAAQEGTGGVLLLTDMFGGTPSTIGLTLHRVGAVEVLTGANLPMLVRALQLGGHRSDLADVARAVRDSGTRAITVASDVLAGS